MKITESQVRYVASLANLTLSDEEIPKLSQDLNEILTYMDALNEVDTSRVEPMAQVLYEAEEVPALREDKERGAARQQLRRWPMRRLPDRAISKFPKSLNDDGNGLAVSALTIGEIRSGLESKKFSAIELTREALEFAQTKIPRPTPI